MQLRFFLKVKTLLNSAFKKVSPHVQDKVEPKASDWIMLLNEKTGQTFASILIVLCRRGSTYIHVKEIRGFKWINWVKYIANTLRVNKLNARRSWYQLYQL